MLSCKKIIKKIGVVGMFILAATKLIGCGPNTALFTVSDIPAPYNGANGVLVDLDTTTDTGNPLSTLLTVQGQTSNGSKHVIRINFDPSTGEVVLVKAVFQPLGSPDSSFAQCDNSTAEVCDPASILHDIATQTITFNNLILDDLSQANATTAMIDGEIQY